MTTTLSAIKTAAQFGCTIAQAERQIKKNLSQLRGMKGKASKTGRKVNGFTAVQLSGMIDKLSAPAPAKPTRKRGIPCARPVAEVLAELDEMLTWPTNAEGVEFSQREKITTLRGAIERTPQTDDFQVVFYSVGNPDFAQYHGQNVLSPNVIVSGPKLADLVTAFDAYVAIYDLGGGNCGQIRVFRHEIEVASISYNGRCWTPFEFGTPEHKEIDPQTGEVIA